ncbi:MAG: Nif3-like dinuclear metal center hexameric protein [Cyanobacteria bacterium P01_D01_bin.105]
MDIKEIITAFEQWANPAWQEKWDNSGWQVEPGILSEPAGVLVCLTPTLAVMEEAIALKAKGRPVNLIFAHHPLIFGGISAVRSTDSVGKVVHKAIAHRIGIYSAHTNFDQVAGGTADVLAQLLSLQSAEPIAVTDTASARGYGRVGKLPIAQPLQQLLDAIQSVLSPPRLLHSPIDNFQHPIETVAVLGGSGAGYLSAVVQTGAQAYLTADCKFHQFQESRDQGLVLIDAGHYATERPACARLVKWFEQQGVKWTALSEKDEDFRQLC